MARKPLAHHPINTASPIKAVKITLRLMVLAWTDARMSAMGESGHSDSGLNSCFCAEAARLVRGNAAVAKRASWRFVDFSRAP